MLDSASLLLAVVDVPWSARAALVIRSGSLSLRRIGTTFRIPYDPNPMPDDPTSVSRREFDLLCVELEAAGVPLKADRDLAWQDFNGWRVNYDPVLVGLSRLVVAPPTRWSSDRVLPGNSDGNNDAGHRNKQRRHLGQLLRNRRSRREH